MSGIDTFFARVGTFFHLGCDLLCMHTCSGICSNILYLTCEYNREQYSPREGPNGGNLPGERLSSIGSTYDSAHHDPTTASKIWQLNTPRTGCHGGLGHM